jgi:hypothetical protein
VGESIPRRIERIAVNCHQFGTSLGAGGRQPFGCRRSVQPWIKSEAIFGLQVVGEPGFRRRLDQRLDAPRIHINLFGRLQRIAAVDKHRGFLQQYDRHAGRSGEAGEPGQPLVGGRYIFVLLLIGAGNHEACQFPAQQFLAKCGQPRSQRHAAFGLFERLEMGFEHRGIILWVRCQACNRGAGLRRFGTSYA